MSAAPWPGPQQPFKTWACPTCHIRWDDTRTDRQPCDTCNPTPPTSERESIPGLVLTLDERREQVGLPALDTIRTPPLPSQQ